MLLYGFPDAPSNSMKPYCYKHLQVAAGVVRILAPQLLFSLLRAKCDICLKGNPAPGFDTAPTVVLLGTDLPGMLRSSDVR